jgi:hypothetical protein
LSSSHQLLRPFDFCTGVSEVLDDDKRASRDSQRALRS